MTRPGDFERREKRSGYLTAILALVFYAGAYSLCRYAYGPILGFAVSSPVPAAFAAWWLLHRGGGGGLRWFKWLALRDIDGRHYAFQDHPVQIRWDEGQCWVRAHDAFAVMGELLDEQALRRLRIRFGELQFIQDAQGHWWFGEAAVLAWLEVRAARQEPKVQKFRLWLECQVFPPLHKRAERGLF